MKNGATVVRDPVLGEEIHRRVLPSGLTVYAVRKRAFTKSYATLATRYGSIDTELRTNGRRMRLPDGIAHFLEHKVFETPEGDAFDLFAARGASANAFTSFSSTRYLFGTSTHYADNLRTLIDMVFDLHVTDENVEKEKGIIGQEIAMYDDDPDWRIYFGALQGMYASHPVRIDIAGTRRTIAGITPELLRDVHASFYHPKLMVLAAVSPEPVSVTMRAVERCVESREFPGRPARRTTAPREARRVRKPSVRTKLAVARPRLILACKDRQPPRGPKARLRHELASTIALDCLFGNSGSVYLDLYEKGLVDDNFSYSYSADNSYGFGMLGGETDDAARLKRALETRRAGAVETGLTRADFERVRNKVLGSYARAFNAPERIAHLLVGHHLRGTQVPDYRDVLYRLTRAQVNRRLRELFAPEARCYSTVLPK